MDLVLPAEHGLLTAGGLPVTESDTQLAHTSGTFQYLCGSSPLAGYMGMSVVF